MMLDGSLVTSFNISIPDVLKADEEETEDNDQDSDVLDGQVALAHDSDRQEDNEWHTQHLHYLVGAR